jgi:hypothetical protein
LQEFEADFLQTLERVVAVFGDHAFQRWQPEKDTWRRQVLASLFDAQMLGTRGLDLARLRERRDAILDDFKSLFVDEEFRKSIDSATNTPTYFKERIARLRQLFLAHM